MQTRYDFTLPRGYVDDKGEVHRTGTMRLATARDELEALPDERAKWDRLVELNVIRQVRNVASDVFVREAWLRGQALSVHGWVYTLGTGLVTDLDVTIAGPEDLAEFVD